LGPTTKVQVTKLTLNPMTATLLTPAGECWQLTSDSHHLLWQWLRRYLSTGSEVIKVAPDNGTEEAGETGNDAAVTVDFRGWQLKS